MTHGEFARYLDATNLKLDATDGEICSLCDEAAQIGYASVCIYPTGVSIATSILFDTPVKVCTVIGFPHGRSSFPAKQAEILHAAENGAKEVDIVMNYAALRSGEQSLVTDELAGLCRTAREHNLLSKIIVETCFLETTQKLQALAACETAGADFIKTSTGFGSAGAQIEDVRLFRAERKKGIKIKASGGIRDLGATKLMIEAGAERIGVSAAGKLVEAFRKNSAAKVSGSNY